MSKIGITGGNGLLGGLLKNLLKKKKIKYHIFSGDITKRKHIDEWLSKNKDISYIFHFAAFTLISKLKYNRSKAYKINVKGTENLIESINKKRKKVFIFFPSTSHVYKYSKKPIKENNKLEPSSYYGKTKLLAEKKIILNKKRYINFCIARIFSVFHKNQKEPFLYPSVKNKIKKLRSDKIYINNANCIRDFLNAEKIIKIIFKMYQKKLTGTFNIGSGKGITIRSFIYKYISRQKTIIDKNKPNILIADIKKLKTKLKSA